MGMGFRLYLKWGFPVQSPFLTNLSSKRCSSSPVRGRKASFDSARLSFASVFSEEGETSYKDHLKAYTCSSAALQTVENDDSELEEIEMNVSKGSQSGLCNMIDDKQKPVGEDKSTFLTSSQASRASHLGLLMENLDVLEETFADLNVFRLERDILVQIERLGALKLFRACLSRTLKTSTLFYLSDAPTELIGEHQINGTMDDHMGNIVVRSGKKEERKSRRERASEKANKISSLPLPLKTIRKGLRRPTISAAKRGSNSRSRRLIVARNEAEMSRGVKAVANLERIRTTLEEETGQVASLSSWAEAAGVDEKVLQQHLHFGWYCSEELLRSTHSLVVYIARNYRGLGVAFDDLLQAGNMGVLKGAARFDHTRGYRFATYVQYWIRKSMSMLVARHARGIRIPFTLSRAIKQIQKARKSLNNSRGKYPDDDEIAKFTGLSLAKIRSASKCLRVVGSLDQKIGDCLSTTFLECIPDPSINKPEETVMRQHMRKDIYDLLKDLDPRESQVLMLRYGLGDHQRMSLEEIGRIFHVSKEWIRKIEKAALAKLRDEETCKNLSYYLDCSFK